MLKKINQMKRLLGQLLKNHDLNDEVVLEVSRQLDDLILEYYTTVYSDIKPNCNNKNYVREVNTTKYVSIGSMI